MLAIWYNSTQKEQESALPPGKWELLIDGEDSWRWAKIFQEESQTEEESGCQGKNPTEKNPGLRRETQIESDKATEKSGCRKKNQTGEISGWQRDVPMEERICQGGKMIRTAPVSVTVFGRRAEK